MEKHAYELHKQLAKAARLFKKGDAMGLRRHANSIIKKAAFQNDKMLADVAIVSYVLHKLLTKEHIVRHENWKSNKRSLVNAIASALKALEANDTAKFCASMDSFSKQLKKIDSYFSRFMQNMLEHAKVKYAGDVYYYGLSLASAASLTGADKKKLQEFIGSTQVHEKEKYRKGMKERLRDLKAMLGE